MEEVLIVGTVFGSLATIFGLLLWFRYRARQDMQQTIRMSLDKGQDLTPELIDRLGHPRAGKDQDLRYALIWLAVAVGLALCGAASPDPTGNAFRGCLAGAAFPFAIGVAYLIMWRFTDRSS